MRRDAFLAIGLICFATIYWFGADAIRESSIDTGVGARALPKGLAYALGGLGFVLLVQTIVTRTLVDRGRLSPTIIAQSEFQAARGNHLRAFGIVLIGAIYLTILPLTGYVLGLFLMMSAIALYMGRRLSLVLLGVMAGGALLYWALFVQALQVPLPSGVLDSIHLSF